MTAPSPRPTAVFRCAAALLRLHAVGDREGFATLISEVADDPVAMGALLAAIVQVNTRLAQDAEVDLPAWLDALIVQIARAEAA